MKNIHVIPTDKPSKLWFNLKGKLVVDTVNCLYEDIQCQNIYITSNEEIKEGDWFITDGLLWKANRNIHLINSNKDKKIILTTDQDLIKDGVQAIPDEFLEWFVKNPSCERVEVWINKFYGNKKEMLFNVYGKYKIIIPREEQKQETLEETCTCTDECLGYLTKTCKGIEEEHKQETFDQYLQRLKDRRTEDNYKYTDEDFKNYIHHIFDCYENHISVYKCLEFMYFMEREIKLEDVFNDEKKEGIKQFIQDYKEKPWRDFEVEYNAFINSGGLNGETGEGWINHSKLIPWLKENYIITKKN